MMHINSLVSKLNLKDPWSAITHGIAMLLAIAGTAPLLLRAASGENAPLHIVALAVFILTMILLYTASTVYHSVDSTETVNRRLRKMDHMMIFVMIAGSYTPICLIALHNRIGYILCGLVWGVAILGILLKGLWITCPKWLSSVLYIVWDAVRPCLYPNFSFSSACRFRLASRRRHYLHRRRHHLWFETSFIQCPSQRLRFT